jgi:hypothetical protein
LIASLSANRSIVLVSVFALVMAAGAMPITSVTAAADEIPHENYDLIDSDLSVVIVMLNSSIRYSERALMCMYNQTMTMAEQNLSLVSNILAPAEKVLEEIEDVASSYENLSALIPPFTELSDLMDDFAGDEEALLAVRAELVAASSLPALTGDDLVAALDAIRRSNELIVKMNRSIDDMLVGAQEIGDLAVDGRKPFADNQLIPLIEKLRDLLAKIEKDISKTINEELPLEESGPFLILWISSSSYYLGDTIIGGGYLFFNGTFRSGYSVEIVFAGSPLLSTTTANGGQFSFAYQIPLSTSWLGTHTLLAESSTPVGLLASDVLSLRIALIPTSISLSMDTKVMSILESVTGSAVLRDIRGNPIQSAACRFDVDGSSLAFDTGPDGMAVETWDADQLGYGKHSIRAIYDGEVPYAPSASGLREVVVDIPTSLDLHLLSTNVLRGQYIVGNGTLWANGTERVPNQIITISLDGVVVANVTTDDHGGFAFTISSESLAIGGHRLMAELLERDAIWRYSQDQEYFAVRGVQEGGYPFWPIIPGWGGGPSSLIPYLFFGKNAYFFWLLLLAFTGVTVRVLQMRKRAAAIAAEDRSQELEPIDSALRASGAIAGPSEETFDLPPRSEGPTNPNERIVWYYQRFMAFMMKRDWPGLRASMTHREVAKILKAWGYPREPVEDATMLFERALYSGARMTDEDTVHMSVAMTRLVRPSGKKGVTDAI